MNVIEDFLGWEMGYASCSTKSYTGQGNDFALILTVKMETRNPLESYLVNEFPSICNYCGVMAA